jgi:hypothetical protein
VVWSHAGWNGVCAYGAALALLALGLRLRERHKM